jgi:hypothetical protein
MIKTFKTALLISFLSLALGFCGSTDTKEKPNTEPTKDSDTKVEEPKTSTDSKDSTAAKDAKDDSLLNRGLGMANEELLNKLNESLQTLRYPDGKDIQGFAYKKWEIPNKKDFVAWVKAGGSVIKKGLDELPGTVSLEISGHTDSTGPEEAVGAKKGNIFYSEQRAKEVKQTLVKLGLPEKRIATKALGSTMPLPGVEGDSGLNRRVTFKFVSVEPAEAPMKEEKMEDKGK